MNKKFLQSFLIAVMAMEFNATGAIGPEFQCVDLDIAPENGEGWCKTKFGDAWSFSKSVDSCPSGYECTKSSP